MTVVYFAVECQVEFDYEAELPDELSIRTGEVITAVKQMEGGWWEGTCKGKRGLFPDNFVKVRQGKQLICWSVQRAPVCCEIYGIMKRNPLVD